MLSLGFLSSQNIMFVMLRFILLTALLMLGACTSDSTDGPTVVDEQQEPDCGSQGDGEGCARLLGRDSFVAGETLSFGLEFIVGSSGIPVGGAVAVGIHHAAWWPISMNPRKRGYVRVEAAGSATLKLVKHATVPRGMFGKTRSELKSDRSFHKLLIVSVEDGQLEPGERLQFFFGANDQGIVVQPYADPAHEFRVSTDVNGDGVFTAIQHSPVFPVLPAQAASLTAVLRSQLVSGVPTELQVRAEDAYHNLATTYSGEVSVHDEYGTLIIDSLQVQGGLATMSVALQRLGPHRLRLSDTANALTGRSNPVRVFEREPERKVYWADLHGHTGASDGLGSGARDYFRFGRDVAKLDINALTDHGQPDWPANIAAVQEFHEPGSYVTLLAQEAGIGPDHMNIYYRRDDMPHLSHWFTNYADQIEGVRQQFNGAEINAMTAPHHFAYGRGERGNPDYPFGLWDERIMRFVEVYSSHGTSEYPENPRPLRRASKDPRKYMQHALEEGLKFGVIAASDNHDSHPGRSIWGPYPGGLAGIWAKELSREAVWDALFNYASYGTSLDRIYVDFRVNGRLMGSTLPMPEKVQISADVIGKTDQLVVDLIRDNESLAQFETDTGWLDIRFEDKTAVGGHFYYLRVTQENGERAWSSPIWLLGKE